MDQIAASIYLTVVEAAVTTPDPSAAVTLTGPHVTSVVCMLQTPLVSPASTAR